MLIKNFSFFCLSTDFFLAMWQSWQYARHPKPTLLLLWQLKALCFRINIPFHFLGQIKCFSFLGRIFSIKPLVKAKEGDK
jgi:hypothetical protein